MSDNETTENGSNGQPRDDLPLQDLSGADQSVDEQDFAALLREGTALLRSGKVNDAVDLLGRAYALQPDNVDAALNLSGALILAKKFRRAVEVLEPLRDLAPNNPMIWVNLGAAYLGNPVLAMDKHQRQAISAFERALELDPRAPSVAYNIGLIYRDRNEPREAEAWFRQALETNPQDMDALTLLGKMIAAQEEEE